MKQTKKEWLKKYKDPRWQKMRLKILERDGWCCQRCFDNKSTLHIHHRFYLKGREPWEYPSSALIALCEECHEVETCNRESNQHMLMYAVREKFLSNEINDLALAIHDMPILALSDVVMSAYCWAIENKEIQKELIERYLKSSPKSII